MGANFTPTLDGYSGQGAFRFWCQKVLPLVYDDSLSYMELLAKVVNYLNNTISDVANAEENISKLANAYEELQDYVNEYFDNLDVTSEVENILDRMATDGTLNDIIEPLVNEETAKISTYVTAWLTENVDPVGSAVVVDKTLTVEGAAADSLVTGQYVRTIKRVIANASIAGYDKTDSVISGVKTENYVMTNAGDETYLAGWSYSEFEVAPNTTYKISGTGSTAVRMFNVYDANDNIIDLYPSMATPGYVLDYEYTTPYNADHIIVNTRDIYGASIVKETNTLIFQKKGNNAVQESEYQWLIKGSEVSQRIVLNGSFNGAFNFGDIISGNSVFKACGDDITPTYINGIGYVGANHGFNFQYNIVSPNHGLTVADIGKTEIVGDATWVLAKIIDTNTFAVISRSNDWIGGKRENSIPNSFHFNGTISVNSYTLNQFYPSVKNISVTNEHDNDFIVYESYDIIKPLDGIEWITQHVGSCDNDSITTHSTSAIKVENVYKYDEFGNCRLSQILTPLISGISLLFYGGVQSGAFTANDYFSVPKTDYKNLNKYDEVITFSPETWDDATVPPNIYMQFDAVNPTKGYALIVNMEDRLSDISYGAGFINYPSRKMYPYAISPNSILLQYYAYCFTSYRVAMFRKSGTHFTIGYYKSNDKYYAIVFADNISNSIIDVPDNIKGSNARIIEGNNVIVGSVISDTLHIASTGIGYALIEITVE